MKTKLLFIIFITIIFLGMTSCGTYVRVKSKPHKEKQIPPGQAKKITGSKSAKYYTPGHNK